MLDTFRQDVRYAWRGLGRTPGFTFAAILTLALGIGANTAIFSVVNGVLLQPLPFPDSEQLVMVQARPTSPGAFDTGGVVSAGSFSDWQKQSHSFQNMAAFSGRTFTLTGRGEPELLTAATVTARFFETIKVPAAIGGTLSWPQDGAVPDDVVVLSDRLWRRRFAADREIIGKPVTLDGRSYIVLGVMPAGFSFPEEVFGPPGRFRFVQAVDLWTPFVSPPGDRNAVLRVFARLEPTITMPQAQAEMTAVAQTLAAAVPANRRSTAELVPLHDYVVNDVRSLLLIFLGAVGFLLLIACVNVANLLVARAAARQQEVAVRAAVGASRGRLVRQFLTESALLSLFGGLAGLTLASGGLRVFVSLIPPGSMPRLDEIEMDMSVLLFTLAVSLAAGLTFGLAPVVHARRTGINTSIKVVGMTQSARLGVLNALVAVEVAFAVVLLVGAGLLLESFIRLTGVDPGFGGSRVMTASVVLPESTYRTPVQMNAFHEDVLERLSKTPGVMAVGAVNWLPFGGNLLSGDIIVETAPAASDFVVAKLAISPDYFRVMTIPLLRGRVFSDSDTAESQPVVIVTERVARRLWGDRNPLGQRVKLGFGQPGDQPWASVVGVVKDVKQTALTDDDTPSVYMPLGQAPRPFLLNAMTFVARSESDPDRLAAVYRDAIHAVDPDLAVRRAAPVDALVDFSVSEPRFRTALFGVFAAVALILVATGILGVLMYSVTRRTKEIGLRIALGAVPGSVARLVVRQVLTVAAIGLTIGLGGALALTRLIRSFLFGVEPTDPAVFASATLFLVAVALLASYWPARRAARVDPLVALTYE